MVNTIPINLTYDNGMISVEPGSDMVAIEAGDAVQWVFIGLPANSLPFIHFESEGDELFGPFQYLETSAAGVIAMGNTGAAGTFPYVAMVLSDGGASTSSIPLSIINSSTLPDTTPHALVTFNPEADPAVSVTPTTLQLGQGQTAIWHVCSQNMPADHFVTFLFDGFLAQPMLGPFNSLSWNPAIDGAMVARATSFSASRSISYAVQVRNGEGAVVAQSTDPVIDPLGSPPWAGPGAI